MTSRVCNDDSHPALQTKPGFQVDEIIEVPTHHGVGRGLAENIVISKDGQTIRVGHDAALHLGHGKKFRLDFPHTHTGDFRQFFQAGRLW